MHHNYEQWTENIQGNRDSTSALLSAFFNKPSRNVTDFTGQRPCPLDCRDLACAVRPTPPQNRRKGIACLCPSTSSKYLLAFDNSRCLMACAASLVFWIAQGLRSQPKRKRKSNNRDVCTCHKSAKSLSYQQGLWIVHTLKCTRKSDPLALHAAHGR